MRLLDRLHDSLHERHQRLAREAADKPKGSILVMVCIAYYALCIIKLLRGK